MESLSADLVAGAVAGAGWGVFLGFLLGVQWLRSLINESGEDE